jgi:hypothetical protein
VDFSHRTATAVELHYEAIAPQWTLSIEQPPTAVELHYAAIAPQWTFLIEQPQRWSYTMRPLLRNGL